MRRYVVVFGLVMVATWNAQAQFVPYTNQPFQYHSTFNPAFSGVESYGDIRLSYRNQWTGFGSDAPKFINLSYNFRLKQPLDLMQNAMRTSKAKIKEDDIPRGKRTIHGFGVHVFNEKVAIINRVGGVVNYAFHVPIAKQVKISGGVSVALENTRARFNEVYLGVEPDPDSFFDNLVANAVNQTDINLRAGLLIYSPRFYVGLSYYDLFHHVSGEGVNFAEPFYKGSVQGGLILPISPTLDLRPSIMALWQVDNSFALDYALKLDIQHKVWLGVAYRSTESFVVMAGFNVNHMLGISYSHERSTNGLSQFSDGSHEINLSLRLNNFKKLHQQLW